MTKQRSFKRLVRARMQKTGERYAAARAVVLAADEATGADPSLLMVSEEVIRRRTGRGWEEWFDLLDDWDATGRPHREVARWITDEHDIDGWSAQTVTVSYERVRGLRVVGEHADGFAVGVQKTLAVPVERLYAAVVDAAIRADWLPGGELTLRTASAPKSARFDWGDGASRVNAYFTPKSEGKSTVSFQHERLPDPADVERMRAFWRERATALAALLATPAA